MKKIILTAVALVAFAQAENVVHYDKNVKADASISKPNHPNSASVSKPNYPSNDIHVSNK